MDVAESGVTWQGDDGEGRDDFVLEIPQFIQPGKGDSRASGRDVVALLMALGSGPFMEATGRNDGALAVKASLPEGAGAQAARSGVEGAVFRGWAVAAAVGFTLDQQGPIGVLECSAVPGFVDDLALGTRGDVKSGFRVDRETELFHQFLD